MDSSLIFFKYKNVDQADCFMLYWFNYVKFMLYWFNYVKFMLYWFNYVKFYVILV